MPRLPNILWIITTQWRASAFGYAGDPNARTPHLNALAAASVNYTEAVTPHPFGPFARAALLTGVPSPENGVADYFDPLPSDTRTIAHALKARGYETAFFGKWHLGKRDPAAALVGEAHAKTVVPPEARGGFGLWEGFESGFLLNDPWLHGSRLPQPRRFYGYQSDVVCGRAAEWIGESKLRGLGPPGSPPWFCVVSLEAPHPPYDAPAAGVPARDPGEIILSANVPRGGAAEARARRELAGYYSHVEATDRAIGEILLPKAGRGETVVVFTSAHGDMHGAHGLFRKGWPHEESVRVPLLIACRRPETGGRKDGRAVSLIDLQELMLAEIEQRAPRIDHEFARISMPSVVALPHQCDRVWRGVRSPTRKLVLDAAGAPWLFFDLKNDRQEMENLAADPTWAADIAAVRAGIG